MDQIIRSNSAIHVILDAVNENIGKESKFPNESYEDGIKAMYDWLVGNTSDNPMEL